MVKEQHRDSYFFQTKYFSACFQMTYNIWDELESKDGILQAKLNLLEKQNNLV